MNLQQLEYIQALDRFRHFGKAADHCNVTQPTLSTMIQKLEEELGVKIFDRSHQPIIPTAVGRRILDQATRILIQSEQIREIVREEQESLSGTISLGILPTIAPYLLPRVLPRLEKELPHLRITFVELKTSECLEALRLGSIQMAIVASRAEVDYLVDHPLYYEEFMGYVPRDSDLFAEDHIRTSDVGKKHLWLLDEGHCFRDQLVKFCHLRSNPSHPHSYSRGSLETFMHFVEQGNGVTFVPELAVEQLEAQHRELVRPFALPRPTRGVNLVTHQEYVRTALIDAVVAIITSSVPRRMHQLQPGQDLV